MLKTSRSWPPVGAAIVALAAGAFVFWQNTRVAVLWDLGYLLDTAWRITLGQMPYRDFPFAHAPLTFLTQAVLIHFFGRAYIATILYAAAAGGLGVWLSWLILRRIAANQWLALALTAPLVFLNTQAVYPHPIYDTDCVLAVLFALWLLARMAERENAGWIEGAIAGASATLPIFYKQNIGLAFAFTVGVAALVLSARAKERKKAIGILIGMIAALLVAVAILGATCGAGNYFHWTVEFAAARRMPGLASIAAIYQTPLLYWGLPVALVGWVLLRTRLSKLIGLGLLAAPFLWSLWLVLASEDAADKTDAFLALWPLVIALAALVALAELRRGLTLQRFVPFFILAAIHGAFMSQQLWGSTYALWPLLMLLVAVAIGALPAAARWAGGALTAAVSVVFLTCGCVYSTSLERLSYIDMPEGSPPVRSTLPALHGMATPGNYLGNFEGMVAWTDQNIPQGEALLMMPGEDPFYYATGRVPLFPVTMMDPATDPYTAGELMAAARRRGVRWVIVKTSLQSRENPMPEHDATMRIVEREFRVVKELRGYEVWERVTRD